MNYGADAADQIVRYSMDGVEHTLRISGAVAKNLAIFIAAVMKDQKKTRGRTRMERMLKERICAGGKIKRALVCNYPG